MYISVKTIFLTKMAVQITEIFQNKFNYQGQKQPSTFFYKNNYQDKHLQKRYTHQLRQRQFVNPTDKKPVNLTVKQFADLMATKQSPNLTNKQSVDLTDKQTNNESQIQNQLDWFDICQYERMQSSLDNYGLKDYVFDYKSFEKISQDKRDQILQPQSQSQLQSQPQQLQNPKTSASYLNILINNLSDSNTQSVTNTPNVTNTRNVTKISKVLTMPDMSNIPNMPDMSNMLSNSNTELYQHQYNINNKWVSAYHNAINLYNFDNVFHVIVDSCVNNIDKSKYIYVLMRNHHNGKLDQGIIYNKRINSLDVQNEMIISDCDFLNKYEIIVKKYYEQIKSQK